MANPKLQPTVEIDWDNFNPENPNYNDIKNAALNFARIELDNKKKKDEVVVWFRNHQSNNSPAIEILDDWHFMTLGLYYYALNRKGVFDQSTNDWIQKKISKLIEIGNHRVAETQRIEKMPKPKAVDPQVRDYRLGFTLASEIEDLILEGRTDVSEFNSLVMKDSVTPKILHHAAVRFQEFVDEMLSFSDEEIEEGFSSRAAYEASRDAYVDMNRMLKGHVENSRRRRKGAAKRTGKVSYAEKRVVKATEKVNYKKEDKEVGVVSIDPSLIVGAKALLVFNTKDRKLGLYHAVDEKGLNIKGTTVQNFDEKKSTQKTLRKPKEQIQSFHKVQLRRAEIIFGEYIKAKANGLTGRINAHTILVASW